MTMLTTNEMITNYMKVILVVHYTEGGTMEEWENKRFFRKGSIDYLTCENLP